MDKLTELQKYLESIERLGMRLGIERMVQPLELLDNPQNKFKSIIVTGTNGKGSTCTFLSYILTEHGYKTGFYSSPHLFDVRERIKINNQDITSGDFLNQAFSLKDFLQKNNLELTYFKFLTILAFNYFVKKKVDFAVLEIGIGGRLDAVNIAPAIASIITNVDLDHQKILGETKEQIAYEKAGIIKENGITITSEKAPEIMKIIETKAQGVHSDFFSVSKDYLVQNIRVSLGKTTFDFSGFGKELKELELSMTGEHQAENTGLSLATIFALENKGLIKTDENKIRSALKKAFWLGRFQIIQKEPLVIADCAHNPHGIHSLTKTIASVLPNKKMKFLIGMSEGRYHLKMLELLLPFANEIIFSQASVKGVSPEMLERISKEINNEVSTQVILDPKEAFANILNSSKSKDIIIVTGSIYLVAEAIKMR